MAGQVVAVQIAHLTDTPDGPQRTTVNLESIRTYCRPEPVQGLVDFFLVLCEDVQARRCPQNPGRSSLVLDCNLRRIK